ncbi:MAG: YkgJ family cysteine cluster protein [Desulfuromonadales bacterium]
MSTQDNPCLTCPDTCCALKGECGLRLSQAEFATHFREHEQGLRVRREGKLVIISTKEGLVCPNLGDKGCRIYAERPIDCRLYPYQMLPVYETRGKVKFMLYMSADCVAGRTFSFPEQTARALVEEFGRDVYGGKPVVIQVYRDRFLPKLKNKCASLFYRWCAKWGIDR